MLLALQSIDWAITLELIPPPSSFDSFIDILYHKCVHHVPPRNPSKTKTSKFHRERNILMRKRTYLRKMSSTRYNTKLIKIEQAICDSHLKEKLNEEFIAEDKIKIETHFFFIDYAKKIVYVRVILDLFLTPTHNYWLMKGLTYVPYY